MKKIVLAGGSGFLGQSLATFLVDRGYEVVILSRGKSRQQGDVRYVQWDGASQGAWTEEVEGCEAVVNFTGKSVNCIYTKQNKAEILRSRLDSVNVLTETILTCEHPPRAFLQAGSLAIFGNTRNVRDEDSPHGTGFSVEVCEQWEQVFFAKELPQTRKVMLRIGFALGREGGALEPLLKLAKANLGGTVGTGQQYISWLQIDDFTEMWLQAIEQEHLTGLFNATGPQPVTNREFMQTLRQTLGKSWAPPAPTPLVWLGAYLIMRTEPSLALTGRNCMPKRFLEDGFSFRYTDLEVALRDLLSTP